jgi:hypothetical protein
MISRSHEPSGGGRTLPTRQEEANGKFLLHFTVVYHQKITMHGEIEIASLLPLLQISNVSESNDIQSIKQYVDQQQNQIKQ